jgi:hypothetical protein
MNKIAIIMTLMFVLIGSRAEAGEPLSTRCIGIKPICMPGQVPICICESAYSFNCIWMCGGR